MRANVLLAWAPCLLSAVVEAAPAPEKVVTVTVTKSIQKISTKTVVKTHTVSAKCSLSSTVAKSTTSSSPSTSTSSSTSISSSTSTSAGLSSTSSASTSSNASVSATSYPSTTYPTTPAYPYCTSTASFAKVDDVHSRLFDYNGSEAKYFAGTNAWWASHILVDQDVQTTFEEIKNSQLQVVRVWGFGSVNVDPGPGTVFFQLLNSTGSYINYAANGIPRLDAVVSYAEKIGIKVVLNFVNNWSDLGGIASYNAAFGGNATTWYTDVESQQVYKDYIELLVTRYSCSPAIFAWELGNEPRCHGCNTSVIYDWATEISQYIKSLDSKHMVTLGDEGWLTPEDGIGDGTYPYTGAEGVDFVKNLGIATLDYGTFHLYPDSWGMNETWGSTWIIEHNAIGAQLNKPVVLEEYGYGTVPDNHTAVEEPWQLTVLDDTQVAMDQFWQFGTPDLTTGLSSYDDNTIWYNATEYQVLARDHAAAMLEKAV